MRTNKTIVGASLMFVGFPVDGSISSHPPCGNERRGE